MTPSTILITGGTSGIGRATAQLMHRRGFQVAITGHDPQTLEDARRQLPDDVLVLAADAGSQTDAARVADEVGARFHSLGALFLNAGISRPMRIDALDEAVVDQLVAVNFTGALFTLGAVLPLLADGGSVVFTVGIGVMRGIPGNSVTAATRGALLGAIPSLALELAPRRIRVNAMSPGSIQTPIWDKLGVDAQARESVSAGIPFGRFGTAEEVAATVAFLTTDESTYVTGQNIVVGGGSGLRP